MGRERREAVGATEGGFQAELLVVAEVIAEIPHDRDVGAGVAGDRLPVVADREEAVGGGLADEGLHQARSGRRDILEFVDQDVLEGAPVVALFDVPRGAMDHVVEVDLLVFVERALIGLMYGPEDLQECLGAFAAAGLGGAIGELFVGQARALEVVKEGRCEPDEGTDTALLFKDLEDLLGRDGGRSDAAVGEGLREGAAEGAGLVLVAVGLDQRCTVGSV